MFRDQGSQVAFDLRHEHHHHRPPSTRCQTRRAAAPEGDHRWQLLHHELPAVQLLEAGVRARAARGHRAAATTGRAAGALHAHPLLPEALPLLLLQGLYRQGFLRNQGLHRSRVEGVRALRGQAVCRRAQAEVHLLRRRHAQLPQPRPAQAIDRRHEAAVAVGRREGNHLRGRAGHAHRPQAPRHPRAGCHAPFARHRALRRPHPRNQRPRASLQGNRPRLRLCARNRLPANQHRPHRRHGRGDRGQVEGSRRQGARPPARLAHDLSDGSAL